MNLTLRNSSSRLFTQPRPVDISLNSVIRTQLIKFEHHSYIKGEDCVIATTSTAGCEVCNSSVGFGLIERKEIDIIMAKDGVALESAMTSSPGAYNCNFCRSQSVNYRRGDGGEVVFDTSLGAWKIVPAQKNAIGNGFSHCFPDAKEGKVHYLTLPTTSLIQFQRVHFDVKKIIPCIFVCGCQFSNQ